MMTDIVDGVGVAASSARLSTENISGASDDDHLAFTNLDTRKRKELSCCGLDAAVNSDQNKRLKHESFEFSGASSDTLSNFLAEQGTSAEPGTSAEQGTSAELGTSAEQGTSAEELGAAEVNTSFWSTDNDNTGDDDHSRWDTSAFSSGEEGFSQRPERRDPFTQSGRHISAFKQSQNRRDDSWSGESNLLQLQLGSFIEKEKLKLESESEEGCSSLSRRSLSDSLRGYDSVESVRRNAHDRFSGNSGLGASSSFAESSENTGGYHGDMYSSRTSSILSSCAWNKKMSGFGLPMMKDDVPEVPHSNMHTKSEEQISLNKIEGVSFSSAQLKEQVDKSGNSELHPKFVLSSGRLSTVTAARVDARVNTIDRDFDDYFAKLML